MNIGELLGAMVQTGMSPSSGERMKNSLGGGNVMDSLSGMLGKSAGQGGGGGMGDLLSNAQGQPQLAAQIYAASLLAIEVDTQAEKDYLDQLAANMGLSPQVTGRIHEMVGLQPA